MNTDKEKEMVKLLQSTEKAVGCLVVALVGVLVFLVTFSVVLGFLVVNF